MSRRARQRRKLLRSTIRSSRETPRSVKAGRVETKGAHAYPRVDALLATNGAAWRTWLEATLRAAVGPATVASAVLLAGTGAGCGSPAQASTTGAPLAVLAPLAPSAPHLPGTPKPSDPVATLLPMPPPPPLPENMPPVSPAVPPPPHRRHPHPPIRHPMLGGVMVAPVVQPVVASGGAPAVDPNGIY